MQCTNTLTQAGHSRHRFSRKECLFNQEYHQATTLGYRRTGKVQIPHPQLSQGCTNSNIGF